MKFAVMRLLFCAFSLILAACSTMNDLMPEPKKIDYKTAGAKRAPTLEVPPDLTSPGRDNRFAVPDGAGKGSATYSAYSGERSPQGQTQQSSEVLPDVAQSRIERAGNERWLVVKGTPDKFWGPVKDFWQENGFVLKIEQPAAGVMETDWAENRAKINEDFIRNMLGKVIDSLYSTAERDKYRTRLEPGIEPGTTDIFISHRGMYETYINEGKSETRWQPRPPDPELEAEMLRRLMLQLGVEKQRAATQIAASKAKQPDRARLTRGADGAGVLDVQEGFDRAWRRVGLALDRVGFTVEDRDRSKGIYFVRYVDPETDGQKKEEGFLSKFAFWKGAPPPPQTVYRIYVKDNNASSTVQVLSAEGGVDQSDTSKKILNLLYEQLK